MDPALPPVRAWTRRHLLAGFGATALHAARGTESAGEAKRFLDAATEFEILRVSGLEHNAWMPLGSNRALTRRGDALLFASDAGGSPQLYRHEFKSNRVRQVTEAAALDTNSFGLVSSDRIVVYFDGPKLQTTTGGREKTIWTLPSGWEGRPRFTSDDAGTQFLASATDGKLTRIYLASGKDGTAVEEVPGDIGSLQWQPQNRAFSYVFDAELRYFSLVSRKRITVSTEPGAVLGAVWSPSGTGLLYLFKPAAAGRLNEIREFFPATGKSDLVAKTSQYSYFQRNGDATVFLGVSGSLASPTILLMLRSVKRELTICEHRASDARLTRAVLSPNSSRMAFQTDRHGKMVIYSMAVERLIEETEANT